MNSHKKFSVSISTFLLLSACVLTACQDKTDPAPTQQPTTLTAEEIFQDNLKKAEIGDSKSQLAVAKAYKEGNGITKDSAAATQWHEKAALAGNAEAQYKFAFSYWSEAVFGEPAERTENFQKAFSWANRSAEQGYADGLHLLASFYRDGDGIKADTKKAFELFQQAAAQNHGSAMLAIGNAYSSGSGIEKNYGKAIEWWEKAANLGVLLAQMQLGEAYFEGIGVEKNRAEAVNWYRKAAEKDHPVAQSALGWAYLEGEGAPKNPVAAVEWFKKAALQGDQYSQYELGRAYWHGDGIAEDKVLSYAWLNLVAAQGDENAKENRDKLANYYLSKVQVAEAQRLSSAWKEGQLIEREAVVAAKAETSGQPGQLTMAGTGTLFILSKDGDAITNNHIVAGCAEMRVEGMDGLTKVITTDPVNDLALLKLPIQPKSIAKLAPDMAKIRQGADIVVYGFPLRQALSSSGNLTHGIVSALTGLANNTNQIQITAPIQPGSSGSPVLNMKGEVVGVVAMKLDDKKTVQLTGSIGQNVNFAVNGQTLKSFLAANKVDYDTGSFLSFRKNTADLAELAREWTYPVQCWR